MMKVELGGEIFLVAEKRPLYRDDSRDRFYIASEVVTYFERDGWMLVGGPREHCVNCLVKSVPFMRLICGSVVSGYDLAQAADMPAGEMFP